MGVTVEDIVGFKKLRDKFEGLPPRERVLFLSKYKPSVTWGTAQEHGKILFVLLYDPRFRTLIEESLKGRFQYE